MITLDLSKAKLSEDLESYKDKVKEIHDMIHNKTGAGKDVYKRQALYRSSSTTSALKSTYSVGIVTSSFCP